ncbi:MAG: ABC transporter ATP-binding protein [Planctomycetota bacterium]
MSAEVLLEIEDLKTHFDTEDGILRAVDGVSLAVSEGTTVALVGESGCGKSVTALSILRLVPQPPGRISGRIYFRGQDLLRLPESGMRKVRGNEISMVFQEPMTALNPVFTVGDQIMEVIILHQRKSKREARELAIEELRRVGISSPETRVDEYPHQLSGGMKQRVMIAMALSCHPTLLIADEPTTALDVTIQAQILELLRQAQRATGMAILLITHDLGVVAEMADQVAVMYASKIVEIASTRSLFTKVRHPYTEGLFRSLPSIEAGRARLEPIPGSVPNPLDFPSGCSFRTRCPCAERVCMEQVPPLREIADGHRVACHLPR